MKNPQMIPLYNVNQVRNHNNTTLQITPGPHIQRGHAAHSTHGDKETLIKINASLKRLRADKPYGWTNEVCEALNKHKIALEVSLGIK